MKRAQKGHVCVDYVQLAIPDRLQSIIKKKIGYTIGPSAIIVLADSVTACLDGQPLDTN
jgi:hypothetical protein